jgi:hypothetical protein
MDTEQEAGLPTYDGIAPPPRKDLSNEDWEDNKSNIRWLYIDRDLPLATVVRRMTQEHAFKAR